MYTCVYTSRCFSTVTGPGEKGTLLQKESDMTWQLNNNKIENTFSSPATNNT